MTDKQDTVALADAAAWAAWPCSHDYPERDAYREGFLAALRSQPAGEWLPEVRDALVKPESALQHYADLHKAKATKGGDQKAAINLALSMDMGEAMSLLPTPLAQGDRE